MEGLAGIVAAREAATAADRTTLALGRAMREARTQAAALVALVQEAPLPQADAIGRHVNYRA